MSAGLVAVGALEAAAPVVAADGFLITRLRAYPRPLPFARNRSPLLGQRPWSTLPSRRWRVSARPGTEKAVAALKRELKSFAPERATWDLTNDLTS